MIYNFLKILLKTALNIFYDEYRIDNKSEIPDDGPLIVVSNHPNTFMDPIILASLLKQDVHFIAKGTLFNSVAKDWIMRNIMRAIPVYRKQDNPKDSIKNKDVFDQCFKFLEEKGTLIIFPEGTSILERKLRDIKTGVARIALGAEARNDFKLGVKILSVGINYSDAPSFRSDVWISIDEVINTSDWKEKYQADDREAVRELTTAIEEKLERNLIITLDDEQDQFIKNVEMIYKNQLVSELRLDPQLHSFQLTKNIQEAVHHFEELDNTWLENLQQKVADYTRRIENYRIEDRFLAKKNEEQNIFGDSIKRIFLIILGFPFFIYGLITNYIPYFLPQKFAEALTDYIEFDGPIKMSTGMLTFPIFYSFLIFLFNKFINHGNWWWSFAFAISLPIAGFFAMYYTQRFKNFKTHTRLISLFYKEPEVIGEILLTRKSIITDLDWGRNTYLNRVQNN